MSFNLAPHDYDCGCARCSSRRAQMNALLSGDPPNPPFSLDGEEPELAENDQDGKTQ